MNKKALRAVLHLASRDAQNRYEARHEILSALARKWGFRLYNRNLAWFWDKDFMAAWSCFPEATKIIHERKFNLFNIARSLRHVPGDLAECGVFRGSSSFLMLAASEGTGKYLHGFDSFEGLSEPTKNDTVTIDRTFKWKGNDLSVPEEAANRNLQKYAGSYALYKGWIPARFDEIKDKTFSLVHIDVDLYEPTLASLEFFWPRLNAGGMIVCDDYGFESCPGARRAMDEFFAVRGQSVVHLTTGQGFTTKPAAGA
jgi:hypothetical protein